MLLHTDYTIGYKIQNYDTSYAKLISSDKAVVRAELLEKIEPVLLTMSSVNEPEYSGPAGAVLPKGFTVGKQTTKGEHVWVNGRWICTMQYELMSNGEHLAGSATVAGETVDALYYLHVVEHH